MAGRGEGRQRFPQSIDWIVGLMLAECTVWASMKILAAGYMDFLLDCSGSYAFPSSWQSER
jgi:hypothetical protein